MKIEKIERHIIEIRDEKVILDSDVAKLYKVETKRINEAVKNNPDKFPAGYIIELNKSELDDLRSKISTTKFSKTRTMPKAFTEKGLYMLATVLKSTEATRTTLAIIETFAKLREFSRNIKELTELKDETDKSVKLKESEEIIAEIINNPKKKLKVTDTETSIEINIALLKFKHLVKRGKEE